MQINQKILLNGIQLLNYKYRYIYTSFNIMISGTDIILKGQEKCCLYNISIYF